MSPPLLMLTAVGLSFGGPPLLDGADLQVGEGDRICLVGRNGSGKSTLLKIAAGLLEPDRGERVVRQGATIRYLAQEPDLSEYATSLAYVEAGLAPGDDPHRARYLLNELGLTGQERPALLSGGESRRAALARVLAPAPDVLLLDEPTNHLDLPAIEWLEGELQGRRSALVVISHDRRLLARLSQATVWLDRGVTRRLERSFSAFEQWRDELLEQEERERHKLNRRIAAEQDWLRYGVTARRKRNMGRLRALQGLRQARREQRRLQGNVRLTAGEGSLSGKVVIEAEGISKAFGGRPLVTQLDLRVLRGDRLGIVGPNGAGKTTLLNLLTGILEPDSGTVRLGANVETVTLDQKRESLDRAKGLAETLTGGSGDTVQVAGTTRHVISYMRDFLFPPDQARTPVQALSGGERARVMLARALASRSNLLVLDEPTNDLDLETLDLLEDLLGDYPGTVLLVSHDRDFLDRVATGVLAFEGDGRWQDYAGGYTDMIAQRGYGVRTKAVSTPAAANKEARIPQAGRADGDRGKRRLSFKQKRALDLLPRRIGELRAEIERLKTTLADAGLFARDQAGFMSTTVRLEAAERELAQAEDQWLELEILRDEIEG